MTDYSYIIDTYVGRRLKEARLAEGLSQQELGERIGVSFQQVQKYERASNRLSASKLYLASQALNYSIPYFFDGLDGAGIHQMPANETMLTSKEALTLVRTYYSIKDERLRTKVFEVLKALSAEE